MHYFANKSTIWAWPHWIISLGLVSAAILDRLYHFCSACCSLAAVFMFFLASEPWLNLHGEPRLVQGYNVAEFYWKRDTSGAHMIARIALAAAKSGRPISAHRRRLGVAAIVLAPAIMFFSHCALADEGGVSFWVPGFFGSLAATPQQPGWSLATIYYHTSVSAGADVARAREFTLGRVPANVTVNANLNLSVNATGALGLVIPTYVFATPCIDGQASVSLVQ